MTISGWTLGRRSTRDEQPMTLRRALLLGLQLGLWMAGPIYLLIQYRMYVEAGWLGYDSHAYWLTAHRAALYGAPPHARDAYLYSPAFAQIIRPIALLPWPAFCATLVAVDLACITWLLAPLGWRWAIPILMMDSHEFVMGQVTGVVTVAAVLAVTWRGGFWAVGWLTKITPGLFGVVWHVSAGQWRQAAQALAVTATLAAVSFAFWPGAWFDWFRFLTHNPGDPMVAVRTVAAASIMALGGRRSWWWAVPVALFVGAPVIGPQALSYLTGLARVRSPQ